MIDRGVMANPLWKWLHPGISRGEWAHEERMRSFEMQDGDVSELSALAKCALRNALHESRTSDGPAAARVSLERLCAAAHASDVRAERLLVVIKEAWCALCEARTAAREHDGATLSRVITQCIEEYYGPRSGA